MAELLVNGECASHSKLERALVTNPADGAEVGAADEIAPLLTGE